MKKLIISFFCILVLLSCQSEEQKQEELLKQKQREIQQHKIEAKKKRIIETKRIKEKAIIAKKEREDSMLQEELLSDTLVQNTNQLNEHIKEILEEKEVTTSLEGEYDLDSDESLTKYVSNKVSFKDIAYIPKNLVPLKGDYIRDMKGNSLLREEGLKALDDLSQNFHSKFLISLEVVSAYRSYDYQKGIKERGCDDTLCAKPGYSEHQSGLAVDLWEASTEEKFMADADLKKYFEWMEEWAATYGFTNSYQKGIEIDGYKNEPWHWRYVGIQLAHKLKSYNISFSEYYSSPENY